jgi:pre-mRNA-splicing factor SYF1
MFWPFSSALCLLLDCLVSRGLTHTVIQVRDFSMIFDAYTQFEETMISAKMEDDGEEEADDLDVEGGDDMDLRLARLQYLLDR